MRLIDADKIMADIATAERSTSKDYTLLSIARYISIQPTIDAEPVKHGKWVKDGEASALYKCSKCGTLCSLVGYANCIPIEQMNKTMKYCNNCGAKMDEVNDGFNR